METETYNPILHKVLSGSNGGGNSDILVMGNVSIPPKLLGNTNERYKSVGSYHNNNKPKLYFL